MSNKIQKIANQLRADVDDIKAVEKRLSEVTDKPQVLEKIIKESEEKIESCLAELGLGRDASAEEVFEALMDKVERDGQRFGEFFGNPGFEAPEEYNKVLEIVKEKTASEESGLFLKKEKAREFLQKEPPPNVLDYLGYDSVEELLDKEDIFEIYSSLRFIEDRKWMNEKFFKQYDDLTPEDFEKREIKVQVLDKKWVDAAKGFVEKKWHNVSHLKELGFIFVIPHSLGIPGELMRTLGLVSHYLHEVPFYSKMFERVTEVPSMFDEGVAALLRGDVAEKRHESEGDRVLWYVVQRYLVKDDPNDWRLVVPHINPEAYHYLGAEEALVQMGREADEEGHLDFWEDMDWVGGFFKDESGEEVRISFDLMDMAFSAVRREEKLRFNYHQHEALWNKIFIEYFSREELYKFSTEYLLQGYFEV